MLAVIYRYVAAFLQLKANMYMIGFMVAPHIFYGSGQNQSKFGHDRTELGQWGREESFFGAKNLARVREHRG